MKEKSSSKKIELEINSLKHSLFKNLTDQELKEIRGGYGIPDTAFDLTSFDPAILINSSSGETFK